MFCSKHIDVKWHSVYFPEIKKTFAVSSLVLNLLASQIGDYFLPHPVLWWYCWTKVDYVESTFRPLSVLQDKVPVFTTVAYCQKKGLVIMILIDCSILEEESEVLL